MGLVKSAIMKGGHGKNIFFVYSPLSGLFGEEINKANKIIGWLFKNCHFVYVKKYSRDLEAVKKRKFVKRPFPEYRILLYKFTR